jgi:hypothetical protein
MLLALTSLALAGDVDCPTWPTSDEFSSRVDSMRERVAFAEPDLDPELDKLLLIAGNCVTGPVSPQDLAGALMAKGAYAKLATGDDGAAWRYVSWAVAIAREDALEPLYGPDVEALIDKALAESLPRATLDLTFEWPPDVLVLDGGVIYEDGLHDVNAGWHAVQWLTEDGWLSESVVLAPGRKVHIGGGIPSVDAVTDGLGPDEDESEAPDVAASGDSPLLEVSTSDGRGRSRPDKGPKEPKAWDGRQRPAASGSVVVAGSYQAGSVDVSDGELHYTGLVAVPAGELGAFYQRRVGGHLGLQIGPMNGPGRASLLTNARLFGTAGGESWRLGAGPALALIPQLATTTDPAEPRFTGTLAYGAGGAFWLDVGPVVAQLRGSWLMGPVDFGGGLAWSKEFDPVDLQIGVDGGALVDGDSRYLRGGLRAAVQWGF